MPEASPGCPAAVIFEFCLGRGQRYPVAFLGATHDLSGPSTEDQPVWRGTLACDQYAGYDRALDKRMYPQRVAAHVLQARRKFDELVGTREVAKDAIQRIGWIYHVEGQFDRMDATDADNHVRHLDGLAPPLRPRTRPRLAAQSLRLLVR